MGAPAERLDDVLVDRGHPDFQAGEVDLLNFFVEIDVEWNVVKLARKVL